MTLVTCFLSRQQAAVLKGSVGCTAGGLAGILFCLRLASFGTGDAHPRPF